MSPWVAVLGYLMGLIREEDVVDGNEQQGGVWTDLPLASHFHTPVFGPYPAEDTQISEEPAWKAKC